MIYIGPEDTEDESHILAQELSAVEIMSRSCVELNALESSVNDLEAALVSKMALLQDGDARHFLQSLDLIQQSLQSLARFVGTASEECSATKVPVEIALGQVHLVDMRNRLGRMSGGDAQDQSGVSLAS